MWPDRWNLYGQRSYVKARQGGDDGIRVTLYELGNPVFFCWAARNIGECKRCILQQHDRSLLYMHTSWSVDLINMGLLETLECVQGEWIGNLYRSIQKRLRAALDGESGCDAVPQIA